VSLDISGDRLEFAVRDDGIGSTAEARAEARARGSFGLISMQARITSLAGELGVESHPSQGTTVFGWLPLEP
jgi:two-component system sensor histidine kinase DegS